MPTLLIIDDSAVHRSQIVRAIEPTRQMQESTLAGAACPHDRNEFTASYGQRDAVQCPHLVTRGVVCFMQIGDFKCRTHRTHCKTTTAIHPAIAMRVLPVSRRFDTPHSDVPAVAQLQVRVSTN